MASTYSNEFDTTSSIARIKTLLNRDLVAILKAERLPAHGVKAQMQDRLIKRLHAHVQAGDLNAFDTLRSLINRPSEIHANSSVIKGYNGQSSPSSQTASASPYGGVKRPSNITMPPYQVSSRCQFKISPFYTIQEPLTPTVDCPVMINHRHTVSTVLQLQASVVEQLSRDPAMRIMIFCAADPHQLGPFAKHDIAFPHQVELKVNEGETKANLRGLKNKPGSTRPADITENIRRKEKYANKITMTYALTSRNFQFVVYLVRTHTVDELAQKLQIGRSISKERVITEMISKAQDSDIVATSMVMSLKCPLSTLRMELPCRSTICSHNQCFDATSFLQLQEQAPTWTCPICNKTISFEALVVDEYVKEILKSTPQSLEQVTIEPNGRWSAQPEKQQQQKKQNGSSQSTTSLDDDFIEIQDSRSTAANNNYNAGPESFSRALNPSVRTFSAALSSPLGSAPYSTSTPDKSKKRAHDNVIDLTLSSDEDDTPPRPVKRRIGSDAIQRIETSRELSEGMGQSTRPLNPTAPVYRPFPYHSNSFTQ